MLLIKFWRIIQIDFVKNSKLNNKGAQSFFWDKFILWLRLHREFSPRPIQYMSLFNLQDKQGHLVYRPRPKCTV